MVAKSPECLLVFFTGLFDIHDKYFFTLYFSSNYCGLDMITLLGLDEYNGRIETTLIEVIKKQTA